MKLTCQCGELIDKVELWILKDFKDFEARKLLLGKCHRCHKPIVSLSEKRITDNKTFVKTVFANDAMRIINTETKRMLCKYYKIETQSLHGWIYGVNKEIKNKDGKVTQVRQYASDFDGNKKIVKKLLSTT